MTALPFRCGIVGARRVAQGLGPFVARDLKAAGGDVVAVLGRTLDSAADAASTVATFTGSTPLAAATEAQFFGAHLDAVCVLSPAGTHGDWVERALSHGCHVLAEKPFLWFPETDWSGRAASLEDRFAEAGLVLSVNAQWPWTLPSVEAALGHAMRGTNRLAMGLQPASSGLQMIGDAAPHPLSLAQAILPDLRDFAELDVEVRAEDDVRIQGVLAGDHAQLEIEMHLDGRPLPADGSQGPRSAWISFDGERLDRCIRPADYALFLRRGSALFDLPDPLTLRIAAFAREVTGARSRGVDGPREPDRTISRRATMLESIAAAYGDGV